MIRAMPSAQIFVVCLLWVMSFWIVLNYILGDAFGPGYSGLALLGYCCAMNQALRISIAILFLC